MHRRPDEGEREVPLFVAAGAYGNVLNLRHLAEIVGAERPFYGLQARGLFGNKPLHKSFEAMALDYLTEIRKVQPRGPYLLGGFCTGGLSAFELAQLLHSQGEEVRLLVLLDAPTPNRVDSLGWRDKIKIHRQRARTEGIRYPLNWAVSRTKLKLERVGLLRRHQTPDEDSITSRSEEIFRQTLAAMDNYEPSKYFGKAILFRPKLDRTYVLGPGRVVDAQRVFVREDNGWRAYIADLEIHEVAGKAGDHDGFILEPAVRSMATKLRTRLRQAME